VGGGACRRFPPRLLLPGRLSSSLYDLGAALPGEQPATSLPVMKTCDLCGKQAEEADALTWVTSVENGRRRTYCETCSREHLRAIEGKLDSEWW
jgi:hypothetical protein